LVISDDHVGLLEDARIADATMLGAWRHPIRHW
jgi:hypothetical protein